MNLIIRDNACIGCGACIAVDPEHFDFDDDGLAKVTSTNELENNATRNAITSCPTNAICIENNGSCDCGNEEISNACDCSNICNDNCSCGDNCNCTEENNCQN